jgi:hypothetical protein
MESKISGIQKLLKITFYQNFYVGFSSFEKFKQIKFFYAGLNFFFGIFRF